MLDARQWPKWGCLILNNGGEIQLATLRRRAEREARVPGCRNLSLVAEKVTGFEMNTTQWENHTGMEESGWWAREPLPLQVGALFKFHFCCSDKNTRLNSKLGKKGSAWLPSPGQSSLLGRWKGRNLKHHSHEQRENKCIILDCLYSVTFSFLYSSGLWIGNEDHPQWLRSSNID